MKNIKKVSLTFVALLLSVVMCFTLTACKGGGGSGGSSKSSPEKVAKAAMEAYYNQKDASAFLSYIHKDYIDYMCEMEEVTKSEVIEEWQMDIDDEAEELDEEYGKCTTTFKVIETQDVDEEYMQYIKEDYADMDIEVEDAKDVLMGVTIEYTEDGEKEFEEDEFEVTVLKIDGRWYLDY